MVVNKQNRVLITGGETYLGQYIALALLAEGAEVSLTIREENENRLGYLKQYVSWSVADVWDIASLKGRARGHGTVIHTVGSMQDDPVQGLTYQRLNEVSARNVATMCLSDGVQHFILLSAVRAPWISRQYIQAKRNAEKYVLRVGVKASIVRAPLVYSRNADRPLFFQIMSFIGRLPILSLSHLGQIAPAPVDVIARGIARIVRKPPDKARIYYARDLRRLNSREELRGRVLESPALTTQSVATPQQEAAESREPLV